MHIGQAKEYIKDSVRIYLKKSEWGEYKIPVERQRPIFLLGAPGLGKTAIMEQVAQELGVAFVSYSMTHHTRQSALGLPFIEEKKFDGKSCRISEYTMSEIIASVYDVMEESGIKEGILFLDEINCVSETLAPSMLQFLQYKVFGKHKVPQGWVIVTAGNPPEYNKSVREFDVVTMDRLRVMEVEADYEAWKKYALTKEIHGAILNYLELNKADFYKVQMTTKGQAYVTARGWEDLSVILKLYEEEGLTVDETLVGQYIGEERIVKEFSAYYDLYCRYKKVYPLEDILLGNLSEQNLLKVEEADFEERLSLLGMLVDQILHEIGIVMLKSEVLTTIMPLLKAVKSKVEQSLSQRELEMMLDSLLEKQKNQAESKRKANAFSDSDKEKLRKVEAFWEQLQNELQERDTEKADESFVIMKEMFDKEVHLMKQNADEVKKRLHHAFSFVEKAFSDGNEMLLLVTKLTVDERSSSFIAMFGSEDYNKHNEALMLSERHNEMLEKINAVFEV